MSNQRKIRGEVVITDKTKEVLKEIEDFTSYQKQVENNLGIPVTDYLEIVMSGGVQVGASDIHFEPEEDQVQMRARIDGILQDIIELEHKEYERLLSRLKLIADLKLNISDRPQDGRFSVVFNEELEVEIRVSSLPSEYGETIVMRLLNPQSLKDLEELGLRDDLLEIVKKELDRPNGMIVATGPTGSGKTTTLYAFCRRLSNPEIKIITIEDPIEYHLEGLSQTQVDPSKGYDFASGLRAIVRQDPDVILVGEMRDEGTVNMALQAALTGHLVLTTLHTNNATGVVARLLSLNAKTANIGPALSMVIGQRLVRRVCSECKKTRELTEQEKVKVRQVIGKLPKDAKVSELQGCRHCHKTGYKGRVGLFEILLVNDEMEELISSEPSLSTIKKKAREQGMTSMKYDGFLKVLEGATTIEEVERVTG